MVKLYGKGLILLLLTLLSACKTVHQQLGQEKLESPLRALVEAPIDVSILNEACIKPVNLEEQHKLLMISSILDPFSVSLYFELNKLELIPDSAAEAENLYNKFVELKPKQIQVIGHTDTSASNSYNQALSLQRAMKIKQELVRVGLAEEIIEVSAEGETNLEVFTPDDTVEVRNRRVEITAR